MSLKRSKVTSPLYSGPYNDFKLRQNFKSHTQKLDFGKLNNNDMSHKIQNEIKDLKSRKSPFARDISERLHLEGHYQNINSTKNQFLTSREVDNGNSDNLLGFNAYRKTNTYNSNMAGKKNNKSMNFSKDMISNKM
jgi:hypothetical protein